MYIERALQPVIREYSDAFKVIALTGPRQVGKTTMLKHLMKEDAKAGKHRTYISLDDTNARLLAKEDPALFLQRYEPPILIDEIQYAPELLSHIKIAVDNSEASGQFWLTGSQPFHMMKHVSESLAGRVAVVEMLGLSDAEIKGCKSRPFEPSKEYFKQRINEMPTQNVTQVFKRISSGSFPHIYGLSERIRAKAYDSYIDTYLMRDLRDLAQVGDELKFRKFMSACASLTGKPVVYAELARIADIDQKTAKSWLSLLVSSYLVKIVQPYSNNLLKRLSKQPIMHFIDTGLAAHLAGWSNAETLENGALSGQIFETFVFSEIYKSYINEGISPKLFFFKTNDKKEIDLLLEEDGSVFPIEIKKSANPQISDLKNFSALNGIESAEKSDAYLKRNIGMGTLVCMASDALPLTETTWAFPAWAI